jgi:hypothetical protein
MRIISKARRADWQPEQGDVIHPCSSGHFHFEHIFAEGELQHEARAAGLRVLFHDDTSFDYRLAMLAP